VPSTFVDVFVSLVLPGPVVGLELGTATTDGGTKRRPGLIEEIGKRFVGEEPVAFSLQERVDRMLIEGLVAEPRHIVEQIIMFVGLTERLVPVENYSVVILPDPGLDRESNLRGLSRCVVTRKTPAHLVEVPRRSTQITQGLKE
jgi:hypothetical protein